MSIWEALGTFGFFGFIFVVLVFCAPALLIWQAYTIFKTMKSKIEKHGSYLVVGLIVFFIISLYVETAGKPETSTQFYEFGSYFGGIGAGIGVLIAGLGYLQSARSEKRAFEKELIDDNLKANITLISIYKNNIELSSEILIKNISHLIELINNSNEQIEEISEKIENCLKEKEDISKDLEKEPDKELKEIYRKRINKINNSLEHFKESIIEIKNKNKTTDQETDNFIMAFKLQASATKRKVDDIQLSISTPLTEILLEQTKLEATYKINKILAEFEDIESR